MIIIAPINSNNNPLPISPSMSKYIPPKAGSKPKMIIIMPIVNSIAGNNPQQIRNKIINPPKIAIYGSFLFIA